MTYSREYYFQHCLSERDREECGGIPAHKMSPGGGLIDRVIIGCVPMAGTTGPRGPARAAGGPWPHTSSALADSHMADTNRRRPTGRYIEGCVEFWCEFFHCSEICIYLALTHEPPWNSRRLLHGIRPSTALRRREISSAL